MKRIAKWIAATVGLILLLPAAVLFLFMKNEGYPTFAGVRNLYQRDGQIRFELPSGYSISEVRFNGDAPYSSAIAVNIATIRVGYTRSSIDVSFETKGRKGTVKFGEVTKLNNWNRLNFRSVADPSGRLSFHVDENGVSRNPDRYVISQTTEPGFTPNR